MSENSENGIKVVCFDAGGVLVRICRTWEEGCAAAGVELRERLDERGVDRRSLNADYQRGRLSAEAFFEGMSRASGGVYSPEEIRLVHDAWIIDEYDGVRGLVTEIHDAGHTTAVLSNTNASHWSQMGPERSMIVMDVHHPHASHLLGHVKPDEAIFRAFESITGFRSGEILFFDDLEENVDGALGAGWRAHRIDHEGDTASQMRAHLRSLGLL